MKTFTNQNDKGENPQDEVKVDLRQTKAQLKDFIQQNGTAFHELITKLLGNYTTSNFELDAMVYGIN